MKLESNITLKILIISQFLIIFSCRTNKVETDKGQNLFIGTKYKYLDEKSKPYADELDAYVKQKANKEILIMLPLPLWVHDFSNSRFDSVYREYYELNPKFRNQSQLDSLYVKHNLSKYVGKSRWLDRFFFKNGEPPVLVDSAITSLSAKNLQQFFVNRGWRNAMVTDTILKGSRKAKVQYNINLGQPLVVDTFSTDINDKMIDRVYKSLYKTNLKIGKRLDAYTIQSEITDFEERMRNLGYFRFNDLKDEMIYYVDTVTMVKDKYKVPVKLKIRKSPLLVVNPNNVKPKLSDTIKSDSIKTEIDTIKELKYHRSTYENIKVILAKDNIEANNLNEDELQGNIVDGYEIVNRSGKYKDQVLADMLAIYSWDEKEKGKQVGKQQELGDKLKKLEEKVGKDKARKVMASKWYKWYRKYREGFYSLNDEVETRRNIYKVNNFNILKFNTIALSDSTVKTSILLTPMEKYSYELGFDVFSSKIASYGVSPNVTFTAKNLFKGAENLTVGFSGTLGSIESKDNNNKLFNASEFSVYSTLSFPKMLLPFNTRNLIPKGWGPTSLISIGYNAQYNIGLDRRNYTTAISYFLQPRKTISHQLTLWNIQYTQFLKPQNYFNIYKQDAVIRDDVYKTYFNQYPGVERPQLDSDFLDQISDNLTFMDFLKSSDAQLFDDFNLLQSRRFRFTQNVLISSLIYRFIFDQRLDNRKLNPMYINVGMELAGNALSLLNKSFSNVNTSSNKEIKGVFGVPYSQFVRFDFDFVKRWDFTSKKSLNFRFFSGIGIPYGNSFTLPFDRNFSVGGPSDVRAWKAFGFGPGTSKLGSKQGFELVALESFKLLSSVEYRFPIGEKAFEGAIFADAGNVWATRKNTANRFYFDKFYKELGIGGGAGIRWDISNFIIRFDFAYKFHDPTKEEGNRWRIKYINPIKPQFNFAIGYPF